MAAKLARAKLGTETLKTAPQRNAPHASCMLDANDELFATWVIPRHAWLRRK